VLHAALFNFKDDLLETHDLTEDHVQAAMTRVNLANVLDKGFRIGGPKMLISPDASQEIHAINGCTLPQNPCT
jgi:hypothetical protein